MPAVLRVCFVQARGFPGALRLRLFPLHDACRWNALSELREIVKDVGDSLAPAVIRNLMDKFWKSDEPYVRSLRAQALVTGRKSYLSLVLEECDDDGETPLKLACRYATADIVRYLVELGASVHAVDVSRAVLLAGCVPMRGVDWIGLVWFDHSLRIALGKRPSIALQTPTALKLCGFLCNMGRCVTCSR
jgi:hypothetical protein